MGDNNTVRKYKNKLWVFRINGVITFLAGLLMGYSMFDKRLGIFLVSIALLALYFILNLLFWKCPVCNKNLPMFEPVRKIEQCKKCGAQLVEQKN